jgi:hypothetical protein
MDLCQVCTRELIKCRTHVKVQSALLFAPMLGFGQRHFGHRFSHIEGSYCAFDFNVTFGNAALIEIIERKRLF